MKTLLGVAVFVALFAAPIVKAQTTQTDCTMNGNTANCTSTTHDPNADMGQAGRDMGTAIHNIIARRKAAKASTEREKVKLDSQDTQTPQTPEATAKPLTNADVLDMLSAGLSQEILIAKIAASACEFDTSPAALKVLKATNVSDAVILAMIQAPTGSRGHELTNAEPSAPARIDCKHSDPVSVYSAPRTQQAVNDSGSDSVEVFKVKCGDRITLLNPDDKQSWLKIRSADGQVGYVSFAVVSR